MMTAIMTTLIPFYEEIMTAFCANSVSNMGWLRTTAVCLEESHWGNGNSGGFRHRHTQYFTMEGVHRELCKAGGARGSGTSSQVWSWANLR